MFTGIIEELGTVKSLLRKGTVSVLSIQAEKVIDQTALGDSIAVNGVCLTVVKKDATTLQFEIMPETLKISNLRFLRVSQRVNLERSLKAGDRISGHFVTGHIDGMGIIRKKGHSRGNICFDIAPPAEAAIYIVPKGSIAVDGISLTVAERKSGVFSVYIIPHTLDHTTLMVKGASDRVNIECDVLMKRPPGRVSAQ